MQPTHHVLVAVLPAVGYWMVRHRQTPGGLAVLAAFGGGLLPDFVDKPLSWTFGILPSGRMAAHSLVVAVPLLMGVALLAGCCGGRQLVGAFAWAYLSHLATDFMPVLFEGTDYYFYANMFWPLVAANPDRTSGFGNNLPALNAELVVELAVIALLIGYALFDIRGPTTLGE